MIDGKKDHDTETQDENSEGIVDLRRFYVVILFYLKLIHHQKF
jgi:hypothetical protein